MGLFGLLGQGNFGNDASLEALLAFLRERHPDAVLECLCTGPDEVRVRYGIAATRMNWHRGEYDTASGLSAVLGKAAGKLVDALRILLWVRRFDAVLVPGSGILESALPVRPWARPYSLLLLCAAGRVCRTRVALVSVGANRAENRATRWLFNLAVRCAHYRSFRDSFSRDAMRSAGPRIADDPVYPDLVFALAEPDSATRTDRMVGVGVMAYYGGNSDRDRADTIHTDYVHKMTQFVGWLLDNDRPVVLLAGDHVDERVAAKIITDMRAERPRLAASMITAARVASLGELMRRMATLDTVVATRYHNVLCALKLGKPTISIEYAPKNHALMSEVGLAAYCQSAQQLDVPLLIEQFESLERQRDSLRRSLRLNSVTARERLQDQFNRISDEVLVPTESRSECRATPRRRR